jgi:signal transduction histidine kinase
VVEERTRIARELHDVVAHAMAVVVLEAGAERMHLPPGQESTDRALRSIEATGRSALAEMRRLVGLLRDDDRAPALAPRPSLTNLEGFVDGVREAGLPVAVTVEGEPYEVSPGLDMSAYRIVQEALTNVLRHAGPAHAAVRLVYGERFVEIEVVDDGHGGTPNGHGHGLTGMRERVGMFGGSLEAGPRPDGEGFAVRARLPVERPA